MTARGFLLLANAEAGSADAERLEAARATLAAAGDVEVVRSQSVADAERALASAGQRRVVVAGGDGSIHLAVQLLWSRDPELLRATPLGLVPLGTGNDLAGGLGLPKDPADAARVCVDGRPRPLDLIVADTGQVVVNAVHAGLGAAAAEQASGLKDKLGALAYPLGALIAAVREAGYELDVSLDGRRLHRGATLMVGVANGPRIGGGTRLVPPAVPDDGLLDVIVVSAVGPAARLAFGAALRNQAHIGRDDVVHATGRQVTIAGEPVTHDLDGELTEELERETYTLRPKAWRLLTPSPSRTLGCSARDPASSGRSAAGLRCNQPARRFGGGQLATDRMIGKVGRVTGTIGPDRLGEVMVPIRGGSEAFNAYSADPKDTIERGTRVVVVEYYPPRTVVVSQV